MKVDLIRFPSMYNTWGRTLYNDTEFTVKLEVRSDRSELRGSGTVFTKIGITLQIASMDVRVVAYESRLQDASNGIGYSW